MKMSRCFDPPRGGEKASGRCTVAPPVLRAVLVAVLGAVLLLGGCTYTVADQGLKRITLPPGFSIAVYARVPGARAMAVLPSSRAVIVGTRGDEVYAAIDADGDFRAERVVRLYEDLSTPNGVAYREGRLYVAEQHRISRVKLGESQLDEPPPLTPITTRLPDKGWHGTRYLAFGPDGRLYAALGSPCNICKPEPPEDAIVSMKPDGSDFRIFASGVRNSVGLAFQPGSGELYFTDNGADMMGPDTPPDELNRAPRPGLHFGFPWYGGGRDRTSDYAGETPPEGAVFPELGFQAHSANLGVHFYRGEMFPSDYRGDAFIAQHGSWNRLVPVGYQVVRVRFDKTTGRAKSSEAFATGWLQGRSVSGRPVDVKELADGSLLVSDDKTGSIYRITYQSQ